jgi:hypothetical protein
LILFFLEFREGERFTFAEIEIRLSDIVKKLKEAELQEAEQKLEDLEIYLKDCDLMQYLNQFIEEGVTCQQDLKSLAFNDLKNLGMNTIKARQLVTMFSKISDQNSLSQNEESSIRVHEHKNEIEINQSETKEMKQDQLVREEKIKQIMKEVSTSYYPSRVKRSAVTLPPKSSRSKKTSSSNSSIRSVQQQLQYSPPDTLTCPYDAVSVSPGKSSTNEEMKTNDYTASDGTVFTLPSAKKKFNMDMI